MHNRLVQGSLAARSPRVDVFTRTALQQTLQLAAVVSVDGVLQSGPLLPRSKLLGAAAVTLDLSNSRSLGTDGASTGRVCRRRF